MNEKGVDISQFEEYAVEQYLKGIDSAISYVAFRGYMDLAEDMIKDLYERKKKLKLREAKGHSIHAQFFSPDFPLYQIQRAAEYLETLTSKLTEEWMTYFLVDIGLRPVQIDSHKAQMLIRRPDFGARFFVLLGPEDALRRLDIDLSAGFQIERKIIFGESLGLDAAPSEEAEKRREYEEMVEEWELEEEVEV